MIAVFLNEEYTYYLPSITSMSRVLIPLPWTRATSLLWFNSRLSTLKMHKGRVR